MSGYLPSLGTMPALNLSNIPPTISTFEELLVYAAMAVQNSVNGATVNVQRNEAPQPRCIAGLAPLADGTYSWCLTAYIPCDQNALASPAVPPWKSAQLVSTAAPSSSFVGA
jgi:hypothetical protein